MGGGVGRSAGGSACIGSKSKDIVGGVRVVVMPSINESVAEKPL